MHAVSTADAHLCGRGLAVGDGQSICHDKKAPPKRSFQIQALRPDGIAPSFALSNSAALILFVLIVALLTALIRLLGLLVRVVLLTTLLALLFLFLIAHQNILSTTSFKPPNASGNEPFY